MKHAKQKHTPGPWYIEGTSVFTKQNAFYVAETGHPNRSYVKGPAECEANARLIAAAPELLEVLEMLEKIKDEKLSTDSAMLFGPIWSMAERAIAKARGES